MSGKEILLKKTTNSFSLFSQILFCNSITKLSKKTPQSLLNHREERTCAQESKMGNADSNQAAEKFFLDAGKYLGLGPVLPGAPNAQSAVGHAYVGHPGGRPSVGHAAGHREALMEKSIGKTSS